MSDQPEVSVDVPAGETVTVTRRVPARFGDREEIIPLSAVVTRNIATRRPDLSSSFVLYRAGISTPETEDL